MERANAGKTTSRKDSIMTLHRREVGPAGYTQHSTPGLLKTYGKTKLMTKSETRRPEPVRVSYMTAEELKAL